jgi:hypothetical protein
MTSACRESVQQIGDKTGICGKKHPRHHKVAGLVANVFLSFRGADWGGTFKNE